MLSVSRNPCPCKLVMLLSALQMTMAAMAVVAATAARVGTVAEVMEAVRSMSCFLSLAPGTTEGGNVRGVQWQALAT